MRPLFRPEPKLPAAAMKTYAIVAPKTTHTRPATCREAGCANFERGWWTRVDESTELGQRQAYYIRMHSGRAFSVSALPDGRTEFLFPPGQTCFVEHTVALERDPFFIVREGDHRGNPRGTPAITHTRAELWVEDFAEHQQRLADRLGQG